MIRNFSERMADVAQFVRSFTPALPTGWLLASGNWDDNGSWDDNQSWNDGS